jgi:antitoxin StbD
MTHMTKALEVLPTAEARDHLSETLRRFRTEGSSAAPVIFGPHRKPEAAVIPFALFERLMDALDDTAIVDEIASRIAEGENLIGWDEGLAKHGVDASVFE